MKQIKKIQSKQKEANNKTKIKKVNVSEDNEIVKLIKIIIVVVLIFAFFVLITYLLNNKDEEEAETTIDIQYSEILVGNIWNKQGNYYVLLGKADDIFLSTVDMYMTNYINGLEDEEIGYYVVNLDSIFNKNYLSSESNIFADNHSDVRFKGLTLLYMQDGEVSSAYEEYDTIIEYVKGLE